MSSRSGSSGSIFQSTHSITECDPSEPDRYLCNFRISIHALHYRVRPSASGSSLCRKTYFNPRTPLQSATARYEFADVIEYAISIHALHYRVRRCLTSSALRRGAISIHALHYRVRPASMPAASVM